MDSPIAASAILSHTRLSVLGQVWKERFGFRLHNIDLERAKIAMRAGSKWKPAYKDVGDNDRESEIFNA